MGLETERSDLRAVAVREACVRVELCADDYGIAPGVGVAVRELLGLRRLSAVSCMTVTRFWPDEARRLRDFTGQGDFGLHFTLTDLEPLGTLRAIAPSGRLPSLKRLMTAAYSGTIEVREVVDELHRQIDRFEAHMGAAPAYLDGHQHVHVLPGARDAVLAVFRDRLPSGTRIRYCTEPLESLFRRGVAPLRGAFISLMSRHAARMWRTAGIPGNASFRGVRSFCEKTPYAALFRRHLHDPVAGMLMMCHPGAANGPADRTDGIERQREAEYEFLRSPSFLQVLQSEGVRIARPSGNRLGYSTTTRLG